MKRTIYYVLIPLLALLMTACGSNSKRDPKEPEPPKIVLPYTFYNATTPLVVREKGRSNPAVPASTPARGCTKTPTGCKQKSQPQPANPRDEVPAEPKTEPKAEPEEVVYKISVQLLKYNLVAPGQSIQMKPFSYRYGTLKASVVDTDESGVAVFEYVPPEGSAYQQIRGQSHVIEAVFLLPESSEGPAGTDDPIGTPPNVVLTQSFLLQFQ